MEHHPLLSSNLYLPSQTSKREANEEGGTTKQVGSVLEKPPQDPATSSSRAGWSGHAPIGGHRQVRTTRLCTSQLLFSATSSTHCCVRWVYFPLLVSSYCVFVCVCSVVSNSCLLGLLYVFVRVSVLHSRILLIRAIK